MKQELVISKLDAAKRQLETAIRLYFRNGDPVSIHTLTAAAYNIIRDINNTRGGAPMLAKQKVLEHVKPEYEKEFRNKINEAENFFKHADKDHSNTLPFNPRLTEILIIDACSKYYELSSEDSPLFAIYRGWFIINNPKLFKEEPFRSMSLPTPMNRVEYFNTMLPLVMPAHA